MRSHSCRFPEFDPVALRVHDPSELSKVVRSEEHTSELQSQSNLVCRLLLEKKKIQRFSATRGPPPGRPPVVLVRRPAPPPVAGTVPARVQPCRGAEKCVRLAVRTSESSAQL